MQRQPEPGPPREKLLNNVMTGVSRHGGRELGVARAGRWVPMEDEDGGKDGRTEVSLGPTGPERERGRREPQEPWTWGLLAAGAVFMLLCNMTGTVSGNEVFDKIGPDSFDWGNATSYMLGQSRWSNAYVNGLQRSKRGAEK